MEWHGRPIDSVTDVCAVMESICASDNAEAEAASFMEAYRAYTPHADTNIGYMIGYYDHEKALRMQQLFGVTHPVFGDITHRLPTTEEAFAAGVAMGERARSDHDRKAHERVCGADDSGGRPDVPPTDSEAHTAS